MVGLSPAHFSRFLKQRTGRSFTDLVNQVRVDRACDLLRRTSRSLVQIALDTGFADQSYFTKVFRRYARVTPRQFRLDRLRARAEGGGSKG
jgi:AraC-like DNA-binding protein